MRAWLVAAAVLAGIGILSFVIAVQFLSYVENRYMQALSPILEDPKFDWLAVRPNGVKIELSGTAPGRMEQLEVLAAVRSVVSPSLINDRTMLPPEPEGGIGELYFRILHDEDSVRIFGNLPDEMSLEELIQVLNDVAASKTIIDRSIVQNVEPSANWSDALNFGISAILLVPDANLYVADANVTVEGILDGQDELEHVRRQLEAALPGSFTLDLRVSAPRPFVVPYRFELHWLEGVATLIECHAETDTDRSAIMTRVGELAAGTGGSCSLARGAPAGNWAGTVEAAIGILESTGGGMVRIEDSQVTLSLPNGREGTTPETALGEFAVALPDGFALDVVPPETFRGDAAPAPPEAVFWADVNLDRDVNLNGRVDDESGKRMVTAFGRSVLNPAGFTSNLQIDPSLGSMSSTMALAGLDALSMLEEGRLTVGSNFIEISGNSQTPATGQKLEQFLQEKLPGTELLVEVEYDPMIRASPPPMDPRLCVSVANEIMESQKISFEPNSVTLTESAEPAIEQLVAVLGNCTHAPIEIAGHTDSQGRQEMNLALSTRRARAVLDELLDQGVLTQNFQAVGYGETRPIADNDTEEGREQNRRIEFRLRENSGLSLPQ